MPNLRTMVTELGTGLGMLGHDDIDRALADRSPVMHSLSPERWDQLEAARAGGAYDTEFHAAWENGRNFLSARDALRGRRPEVVEWKGVIRAAGDEVAPIDLRIDHVYLVSCKYLSDILFNVSPAHVFDDLLVGGQRRRGRGLGGDWFAYLAPAQFQQLYEIVRGDMEDRGKATSPTGDGPPRGTTAAPRGVLSLPGIGPADDHGRSGPGRVTGMDPAVLRALPAQALDLTTPQRAALAACLKGRWSGTAKDAYGALSRSVAQASVARWQAALGQRSGSGEAMLWRLLRMGNAPYFVLGSSPSRSLRLRVATPWDWRQQFSLDAFEVFTQAGGQARVGWLAQVRERSTARVHEIAGHVEVRWSHGRFSGPPEAKGYLDTPHHLVPGYFPLQ